MQQSVLKCRLENCTSCCIFWFLLDTWPAGCFWYGFGRVLLKALAESKHSLLCNHGGDQGIKLHRYRVLNFFWFRSFCPSSKSEICKCSNQHKFLVRKSLVKWTSAVRAVVKSGTGLPSQNHTFGSTPFQPALINLPKLCLLKFVYGIVLQPCAAQQKHFLSLLMAFGTGNFKLNKLLVLGQQSLNSNHFLSPFSNCLVPSHVVYMEKSGFLQRYSSKPRDLVYSHTEGLL